MRVFAGSGDIVNPLSANQIKSSNTLKQFVGKHPTNFLSVFEYFVELALEWLSSESLNFFLNNQVVFIPLIYFTRCCFGCHSEGD